ncbi:MAG TPA: pilus assembly PilX N-terminal domain-containing protein, partial [candidate division Zixibacteria bacterium]|nr:pilus assembly PilX N-terminal domain-containing protein [candidate division Zixibacteria bacterium]
MKAKLQTIRGSALLIALLLTGMLSLIAIMAIESSNTDIELSYSQSHLDAAFYNAEAGAKRAFVALNDNDDWRSGYADFGFGQGT